MSSKLRSLERSIKRNEGIKTVSVEPETFDIPPMKIKKLNRQVIYDEIGYMPFTTFYEDFSIADAFGVDAIIDTYKRATKEWIHDVKYFTELVMVLNWKSAEHYNSGNATYNNLYAELFYEARDKAFDTFEGDDLRYFYETTD